MKTPAPGRVSTVAAGCAGAVGGVVLVGWALDIAVLKSVVPGFRSMQANTAIGFMLLGAALWLSRRDAQSSRAAAAASVCASMVVAIAALTLAQSLLGQDFGIDQALFRDAPTLGSVEPPGRMAPATAVSFIMLGLALLLSRSSSGRFHAVVQALALLATLTGLLAILGYAYGARPFYTLGSWTRMSLHTAVTILVASAGVLAISADRGVMAILTTSRVGGVVARRLLPITIVLLTILGWLHLKGENLGLYGRELGVSLLVAAMIVLFSVLIAWTAASLNRMDVERIEAEEQQRTIIATALDGFWILDSQGRLLEVNEAYARIIGYTRDELLGMAVRDLEAVEIPEETARHIRRVMETGGDRFETRHRRKDGALVDLEVSATWPGARRGRLHVFLRDITERKRAQEELARLNAELEERVARRTAELETEIKERKATEESLRQSEEKFRGFASAAQDAVILLDPDGCIAHWNASAERIFGYSAAEAVGRNVHLLLAAPRFHETYRQGFPRFQQTGQGPAIGRVLELAAVRKGGREFPIELSLSAVALQGRWHGLGMVRDITDRKIAEEELRKHRDQLEILVQERTAEMETSRTRLVEAQAFAHMGSWDWDPVRDVVAGSDEFYRLFGVPPERLKSYEMFQRLLHPGDVSRVEQDVAEALANRRPYDTEYRIVMPDGRHRSVMARGQVQFNETGKPAHMAGTVLDITERKQAERELQAALAELKRSNEELERFAYVASHDLQEPLRMVASYTQLLAQRYEDKLDDKARLYIGYAVDGAVRMQRMITDLLAYSRVRGTGKPIEPTDPHSVLGEAVRNLAAAIQESGAVVVNGDLPTVRTDPAQLTQVFQNLVGNAIKFRRPGEPPRVHVSASRSLAEPPEWVFALRDNGIGIDPKFKDKLFVIFRRLHTREEYPGTGIGLALCKRIVERHGGRIWFESAPGEGSTFYFTLPA